MSDNFSARYRLLKCVAVDDGIRTHNAQEISSGRVVMVHITDAAGPDEVETLRAQLAQLNPGDKNRVLETATLPSGFAVVTEFLPASMSFRNWLAANSTAPQPGGDDVTATGRMAAPAVTQSVVATERPSPPPASSGSFTQLFGTPDAPPGVAPQVINRPAETAHATAQDATSRSTTLTVGPAEAGSPLQGATLETATPETATLESATATAANSKGLLQGSGRLENPGEATPATPPSSSTGGNATSRPSGSFTQMFAPVEGGSTARPANTGANPAAAPAGSFTQTFGAPAGGAVTPPPTPLKVTPTQQPAATQPGSFTQMFAPQGSAAPPPSQPGAGVPPNAYPAQAESSKKTPGEFTQMFGRPDTVAPLPDAPRQSPMGGSAPPVWSPLAPEQRHQAPPVTPNHRQSVFGSSNSPAGGPALGGHASPGQLSNSPFGVGSAQNNSFPNPAKPVHHLEAAQIPALQSPMSKASGGGGRPSVLPPPLFKGEGTANLSTLGGASAHKPAAGPSDFTRMIQSAAEPVIPERAVEKKADKAQKGQKSGIPMGLIIVVNAIIIITVVLVAVVWKRPASLPEKPKLPPAPTAPKLPAAALTPTTPVPAATVPAAVVPVSQPAASTQAAPTPPASTPPSGATTPPAGATTPPATGGTTPPSPPDTSY